MVLRATLGTAALSVFPSPRLIQGVPFELLLQPFSVVEHVREVLSAQHSDDGSPGLPRQLNRHHGRVSDSIRCCLPEGGDCRGLKRTAVLTRKHASDLCSHRIICDHSAANDLGKPNCTRNDPYQRGWNEGGSYGDRGTCRGIVYTDNATRENHDSTLSRHRVGLERTNRCENLCYRSSSRIAGRFDLVADPILNSGNGHSRCCAWFTGGALAADEILNFRSLLLSQSGLVAMADSARSLAPRVLAPRTGAEPRVASRVRSGCLPAPGGHAAGRGRSRTARG